MELLNNFLIQMKLRNRLLLQPKSETLPKIIFRTFSNKTVSNNFFETSEEWKKLNPEYNIVWYDNKECDSFMKQYYEGEVFQAYQILKPGAYKADLWRLCILYKYGGVYVDAHSLPHVSLDYLLEKYNTKKSKIFISILDSFTPTAIHNGFIISEKGHPFLLQGIKDIVSNVNKRYYGFSSLHPTGPVCLERTIRKFTHKPSCLGWNKCSNLSFYLLEHIMGIYQYIYDKDVLVMQKYYSMLMYLYWKITNKNGYKILWNNHDIYN